MSEIKGQGRPTRQTAGGVGDVYIDTATGVRYKCTAAFGVAGEYDYQWNVIRSFGKNTAQPKAEDKPVEKPIEVEEEPVKVEEEAPVEEVTPAPKKSNKSQKKAEKPAESVVEAKEKKVDYAAAYKSKNQ